MPTIRLHVPEADLELLKRAAVIRGEPVQKLIVEAAESRARDVIEMKRRDDANEMLCGCTRGACICDFA